MHACIGIYLGPVCYEHILCSPFVKWGGGRGEGGVGSMTFEAVEKHSLAIINNGTKKMKTLLANQSIDSVWTNFRQ